ncbi:hypothetical protein AVEN_197799-1 [Araneus ventricosus]|uniref:Uncharacterized protein n=1 Tax=Araneus ventricosus TaxID=182803 RepID=A0A4Y2HLZ1_ARAVE|nr:hypothetical protein AVEN_197799-1 [Araneus ventricosus]
MFATCAFVLDFCIRIHQYNMVDVIEYGHMFWAMYFDKFTKEFYERGGWPELKVVAESYSGLDDFFWWFEERSFFELIEAIENYHYFIASGHYSELKSKHKKEIHASKLWIKFCIEQFESYSRIPLTDQYPLEACDVEYLLEDWKAIFEIILKESAVCTIIECSEISTDHAANKTNTNDYLGIEHLPERKCETPNTSEVQSMNQMHENLGYRKPPPYNVPDETIFCSGNERASGNKEVNTEKTLEMSSSSKNEDDRGEIDNRMGNIPASHMLESECNRNIVNLNSLNSERQYETSNAPEVLTTKQMDKSLCYGPHPCRVPEMPNLCSQNVVVSDNDEEVSKVKTLEVTHYSKNGVDQAETAKRKGILSSSKISKSELDENSSPHVLPTRQFIDTYIDNLYSRNTERLKETSSASEVLSTIQMPESERDGKTTLDVLPTPKVLNPVNRWENNGNEMKKVDKAREDLRNDKEDPEVKNFLRLLLVLGDKEGTEFVFSTLKSKEETPEKSQENSNKQKKRYKKKKDLESNLIFSL